MPTSGLQLKIERTQARVSAVKLALLMGVTKAWLSQIENQPVVSEYRARIYRQVLKIARAMKLRDEHQQAVRRRGRPTVMRSKTAW
jgi:transcriptional regulator with XRE-family HTH domain